MEQKAQCMCGICTGVLSAHQLSKHVAPLCSLFIPGTKSRSKGLLQHRWHLSPVLLRPGNMLLNRADLFECSAAQAELDAAQAEGGQDIEIQLESGGVLKVHPGQELATEQSTGTRYRVTWAQDDRGAISVRVFHFPCDVIT